jgi:hypothetical protein
LAVFDDIRLHRDQIRDSFPRKLCKGQALQLAW